MRQIIGFHATAFVCHPIEEYELPEGEGPLEPGSEPAALLEFRGGQNVGLQVPISKNDAEGMMEAFTQAEPLRQTLPTEAINWQPETVGLPDGMFWFLTPQIVGMSVTPPHQTDDGLVPHWSLAFQDADDSQVQVAVSDALCVQVIRALAQVSHGEFDGAQPSAPDDDDQD